MVNMLFVYFKVDSWTLVIETNKVKKKNLFNETRQYNIYKISKNNISIEEDKSKLQKSKLLILIEILLKICLLYCLVELISINF